jgi:hypothetical protein
MSSILDSLASAFGPDVVSGLGKALGADPAAITKGFAAAGPLALAGMTRMAGTPGGADTLMKMLPQDSGGGMLGGLSGMLGGLMGGGGASGAGGVSSLLGPGVNAIGASLSRVLGFNVTPLLGMVVPAALAAVSKMAKAENLDASGLAAVLKAEQAKFVDNPANKETVALVAVAMQSGDKAAAKIASFGTDWGKVQCGPAAAVFAVATADLSGPLGTIKEVQAASKAIQDAAGKAATDSVLVAALGGGLTPDIVAQVKALAPTKDKMIDLIKAGVAAVVAKSPADAQAYKETIRTVAQATAEASKEGGFLGFGGTLVSKDEQAALDAIKAALA